MHIQARENLPSGLARARVEHRDLRLHECVVDGPPLTEYLADPDVEKFMKDAGMYVPGVYLIPEVRDVAPGHLVRSGNSSAYDVNFGYRAGAAAVLLLLAGKTGNTVVNLTGKKIAYVPTTKAIKRREVDVAEVALFEGLGICFGRTPGKYEYELFEAKGTIGRYR